MNEENQMSHSDENAFDTVKDFASRRPAIAILLPVFLSMGLLIVLNLSQNDPPSKNFGSEFVQKAEGAVADAVKKAEGPVETTFRGIGWAFDKAVDMIGEYDQEPNGKD